MLSPAAIYRGAQALAAIWGAPASGIRIVFCCVPIVRQRESTGKEARATGRQFFRRPKAQDARLPDTLQGPGGRLQPQCPSPPPGARPGPSLPGPQGLRPLPAMGRTLLGAPTAISLDSGPQMLLLVRHVHHLQFPELRSCLESRVSRELSAAAAVCHKMRRPQSHPVLFGESTS